MSLPTGCHTHIKMTFHYGPCKILCFKECSKFKLSAKIEEKVDPKAKHKKSSQGIRNQKASFNEKADYKTKNKGAKGGTMKSKN